MSCGWPDNFCICWNLKDGGKIIGFLCVAASIISCIILTIYLCSDFDAISKEIAENNKDMIDELAESNACKFA